MSKLVDEIYEELGPSSEAGPDEAKRIIAATLASVTLKETMTGLGYPW